MHRNTVAPWQIYGLWFETFAASLKKDHKQSKQIIGMEEPR